MFVGCKIIIVDISPTQSTITHVYGDSCRHASRLVPSRIALTRAKIRLVTLGTEIGARTTHGMWNCAEIIMIAK